jgi:hypothetical protein
MASFSPCSKQSKCCDEIMPALLMTLSQTFLVTRNQSGELRATVVDGYNAGNSDEGYWFAEVLPDRADVAAFDSESVYLLAWQTPSVTATLTGLSDGVVVGSTLVEVGNDPTQIKVDWSAIDQLAISYTGAPGFPVTDNFFFL